MPKLDEQEHLRIPPEYHGLVKPGMKLVCVGSCLRLNGGQTYVVTEVKPHGVFGVVVRVEGRCDKDDWWGVRRFRFPSIFELADGLCSN